MSVEAFGQLAPRSRNLGMRKGKPSYYRYTGTVASGPDSAGSENSETASSFPWNFLMVRQHGRQKKERATWMGKRIKLGFEIVRTYFGHRIRIKSDSVITERKERASQDF